MDITKLRCKEDPRHAIVFSVDLGKQKDHTAWAMVEVKPEERYSEYHKRNRVMMCYVRDLVRAPLGTPYAVIQREIRSEFFCEDWWLYDFDLKSPVPPQLLVDAGGVGLGIVDNLGVNTHLRGNMIKYSLTRGSATPKYKGEKNYFTCPRTLLFQELYAAFHDNRIAIEPRLELAPVLTNELKNLRVEQSEETGQERVVHREGEHDDLSICVGAANFVAGLPQRRARAKFSDGMNPRLLRSLGFPPEAARRTVAREKAAIAEGKATKGIPRMVVMRRG